ncbi:MAG: hypothetical protein KKB20_08090 [Proteobacteria bacterium]|nr:hypothetical protein [Pseudomonadota bacterium]
MSKRSEILEIVIRAKTVGLDAFRKAEQMIEKLSLRIVGLKTRMAALAKTIDLKGLVNSISGEGTKKENTGLDPQGLPSGRGRAFPGQDKAGLGRETGPEPNNAVLEGKQKRRDALIQSAARRSEAVIETEMAKLESLYDRGLVSVSSYYDQRKAAIETRYQAEVSALQKLAGAETDPAARIKLDDELFSKEQAHARELLKLTDERANAEDQLAQKRADAAKMLSDIRLQNMPEGTLGAQFSKELQELDQRHQEDLARFKQFTEDKATIAEYARQQELAKDKLLADQQYRLMQFRLQTAEQVARDMSSAFDTLYQASGENTREFFYLFKAAALAQAIISMHAGIMEALKNPGGYLGMALAVAIAAKGAASIAAIRAQTLAEGGLVLGRSKSRTADDQIIAATSGEYVSQVDAVRYYGPEVYAAMNRRAIPRDVFSRFGLPALPGRRSGRGFASGGLVGPASGGSGPAGGSETTIVNVLDLSEIDRHLMRSNVVWNVISSNTTRMKRILRS